jgi:predicted metal-dependent enzyme (double-stranded beta helix superfamily)
MNANPFGIAEPSLDAGPGLAQLLAAAERLAADTGLVGRVVTEQDQRSWLPLDTGPGMRAWLIAWPPGTGTGWHDHGGAAGAMFAVAGELTERSVEAPGDHEYGEPLHLANGEGAVRKLRAGTGRAFGGQHIHEVTNDGPVTAYSVHVYAPDLALMRHYAATGESLVFVGWETEQDW